jgi:hypothetical protein
VCTCYTGTRMIYYVKKADVLKSFNRLSPKARQQIQNWKDCKRMRKKALQQFDFYDWQFRQSLEGRILPIVFRGFFEERWSDNWFYVCSDKHAHKLHNTVSRIISDEILRPMKEEFKWDKSK